MNAIRTIRDIEGNSVTVALPDEMNHKRVEIIIFPIDDTTPQRQQHNLIEFAGIYKKLEIEPSREAEKLRDEWERGI
ncbi:MAG: hypothetical protein A2Y33_14335 [Spirochaetes bacterium GWF1_51_8]|nr:MAG: hypothetical protein A2Y33_14335 [Spirochaetes bacterium GWF1_51_8]